jgi:hypothetical protein
MFEKFTSDDRGNFRQRYLDTFGFFRNEDKEPLLVKLISIEGVVTFADKRGIEYTLYPDSDKEIGFQFLPPKSGMFNTGDGAVYVQRSAARQFQRGISGRNTTFYLLDGERFITVPVSFGWLEKIFYEKITVAAAMESFLVNAIPSVAISKQFSINGDGQLFVFSKPCGKMLDSTKERIIFKLDDPSLFRTEIKDALSGIINVEFA